jgi:hypothetical protein
MQPIRRPEVGLDLIAPVQVKPELVTVSLPER